MAALRQARFALVVQADHNLLRMMLRQIEGTWASGCDELLSLVGPQLISLLDSERVIEVQIRVEVLQALASALVRASQVRPSGIATERLARLMRSLCPLFGGTKLVTGGCAKYGADPAFVRHLA